jgi:hypothetical protein
VINASSGRRVSVVRSFPGRRHVATVLLFVLANITGTGLHRVASAAECALITDSLERAQPSVAKPGYLQSFKDPLYGTVVTRITGDPGTPIPTVGGVWGNKARHNYSKDAVWNADQSLMVLKQVDGVSGVLFLDGTTYKPLFSRVGPGGEVRWHPSIADAMVYLTYACEFGHWNVRTNVRTPLLTPAGYSDCYMGPWEGNTSSDGSKVAAYARRVSDGRLVAFVVDLGQRIKYSDLDLASVGVTSTDWVSVSASGRYLVVNGTITGCRTVSGYCDATKIFTLQGAPVGPFWSEYGQPSHYDLTINTFGEDVAVGVSKSAPTEGKVIMRRLVDGQVTPLTVGGYAGHTSTRSARAGWAYVSHPYNGPYWPPFRNETFAVKLDGSLAIERLGNVHTTNTGDMPTATPSPDGRRAIFASNWLSDTGPIQAYVLDARPLCTALPPPPPNVHIVSTLSGG